MKSLSNLTIKDVIERAVGCCEERRASAESVNQMRTFFEECGYRPFNPMLYNTLCRFGASEIEHTSRRGLFIKGDPGIGKTFGLELMALKFGWQMVPAIEVEGFYKTQPCYDEWEEYCRGCDFFGHPKTLVIDDLGTEKFPFTYYGQTANPLEEMLEIRYRISHSRDHVRTIVTTNLTDAEILQRYGFRIFDRMNEMFAVVTIRGESLRK